MSDVDESQSTQPSATDAVPSDQLELKLPDESSAPKDLGLWAGVLVLLTLIVYWPATGGRFLPRDDRAVVSNLYVRNASSLSSSWFLRWRDADRYPFAVYQPVTASLYWLEYRLGGHADQTTPSPLPPPPTPLAFHLANVVFHAGAAVLLWLALRELLIPGAWVVAAVFALHPLNAEPVSWIADQDWSLGGLLFFAGGYLYLQFVTHRETDAADRAAGGPGVDPVVKWGLYIGFAAACILAVLANPATAPLPLVLMLALWWRKRLTSQDNALLIPLIIISIGLWLSMSTLRAQGDGPLWHRSWQSQAAAIGSGLLACVRVIAPVSLKVFHAQWGPGRWWLGLVIIACWAVACVLLWIKREAWGRGIFAALVIFGLVQIFSLNWFDPFRAANFTDATSYLASVPVIAVAVSLIILVLKRIDLSTTFVPVAIALSAATLLVFGGVTWARTHVFDNPVAFWQDAVKKDPQSSVALGQLAEELRLRAVEEGTAGDADTAKADLAASLTNAQQAAAIDPKNAVAQETWANVLIAQGEVAASLPHFQQAAMIRPDDFQTHNEYGSAFLAIKKFKEAIPQLNEALRLDSTSAMAHRLLGVAYGGIGNTNRAIKELQISLDIDPTDLAAREALADMQAKAGQLKPAIESYAMVLADKANQSRPDLWIAIARIKEQQYDWSAAVDYFKAAQHLAPADAEVKKSIETDTAKAKMQAATRPTTRAATAPSTLP